MSRETLKLHNAAWPGVVGKGPDTPEPFIDLDTMVKLTTAANADGARFDGIDLFLSEPHVAIDSTEDDLKRLSDKVGGKDLAIGSLVAPVWSGCAFGDQEQRAHWLEQVRKACVIGKKLREFGARPYGVVRIDSSGSVAAWAEDASGNTRRIIETFRQAAAIAEDHGERLAAEGEICWGGMHSWRAMLDVLEGVGRPETLGFQADLAHSMLYLMGYNAPENRILPEGFSWDDNAAFQDSYLKLVEALRPWTIDFHVAQSDGSVKGQGTHDKTGRHCLPDDAQGKLDISWCASLWLQGAAERGIRHICWDGCMFTNEVMARPETWNAILNTMLQVRGALDRA